MEDDLQWKRTSNGRLPLKSKVKYLNNYWSDLPQILDLGLCDQNKLYKLTRPPMEDDLQWKMTSKGRLPQKSKMKYLSNYWSDLPQNLNSGLCDQTKLYEYFKWRWPTMEDDLKWKTTSNIKSEISKLTGWILPKF